MMMMKKIYTFILSLFISGSCLAQNPALPNAGFEFWTQVGNHLDPNNWNTLNPSTAILGVFTATRSSSPHSGSYAIQLTTKSVFLQIANGIATTGTLITTPPYGVVGGIPYEGRPDSIAGWYKFAPAGTDSGFVQFMLQDSTTLDTIGFVRWETHNIAVGTYTRFSAPITYYSTATPNLSCWILSSSRASNPVVNSSLTIDDLQLIFNPIVCNKPTGLSTSNITSTGAKLKWGAVTGAINYQQKYRAVGTATWINKTSTTLSKTLSGLSPNMQYEWAVRAKCSGNPLVWSAWSSKKTFTTLAARKAETELPAETETNDLSVYPNPARESVNLSLVPERDELLNVNIYNAIGQVVYEDQVLAMDGQMEAKINTSGFQKGIYLVTVTGTYFHSTKRLLIQ